MNEQCGDTFPMDESVRCARPKGHDGPHEALEDVLQRQCEELREALTHTVAALVMVVGTLDVSSDFNMVMQASLEKGRKALQALPPSRDRTP